MVKKLTTIILTVLISYSAFAKANTRQEFLDLKDTLSTLCSERMNVRIKFEIKNVMVRGNSIDLYLTKEAGDYPWRNEDLQWFKKTVKELAPEPYHRYKVGEVFCNRLSLNSMCLQHHTSDGQPFTKQFQYKEHKTTTKPLVKNMTKPHYRQGLEGAHIALWQSHGKYYDQNTGMWRWQRPPLFQTCEDMFTQSIVLPYLVPMLENAGAVAILPRERDTNPYEIIADNDPAGGDYSDYNRLRGSFTKSGKWEEEEKGFADTCAILHNHQSPFDAGSSLICDCRKNGNSKAQWELEVPYAGNYAVYVSYKTMPNSSSAAEYSVKHAGGTTPLLVNQQMSGGTWVYLGTFHFVPNQPAIVTLTNKGLIGKCVSADAVKIGGGMGNVARSMSGVKSSAPELSGLPRYLEGARYSMQWYGVDTTVYSQNLNSQDYRDDFMSRGEWTQWLSGGSSVNPIGGTSYDFTKKNENGIKEESLKGRGQHIPLDLAFALHSDAGIFPNDSIVGTLAIYTLKANNKNVLPNGEDRMTSRQLADIIQSQVVEDIQALHDSEWMRRGTWDRSYSETRTPAVPAIILELLSHQHFEDMKYGLDPQFRFDVARAIYKGMVKYLSNRYNRSYNIQPLPVHSMAVSFVDNEHVKISWKATEDRLEPTADAQRFRIYTRLDGQGFDNGKTLTSLQEDSNGYYSVVMPIAKGVIHSWKVTAENDGGESFPSEILSAGLPTTNSDITTKVSDIDRKVLIVNNFDRVSGPTWFDTEGFGGFRNRIDSGVPYIKDISFIGEQYDYNKENIWINDYEPGFGASNMNMAGQQIAGNTFDFPYIHGKSILRAGYAFCSTSAEAFANDTTTNERNQWNDCFVADIICGKQTSTITSNRDSAVRFSVFPIELQNKIKSFTSEGRNIIISGSNIASDVWNNRLIEDDDYIEKTKSFVINTLGYKIVNSKASRSGEIRTNYYADSLITAPIRAQINTEYSDKMYRVESPDGIKPANWDGNTIMRYCDTGMNAAILYQGDGYKTVCFGFPLEAIANEDARFNIIMESLNYFKYL